MKKQNKPKRYQVIKRYLVNAETEEEAIIRTNIPTAFEHLVELKVAEKVRD